ncbi:uncharacterized protein LOC131968486 isoform X2 [Centropristis striata]|uniref:uncharacterized protein LOC131968486 isoform X2 n=1 Tax=Centropristis striata TaxID=184440 RepID=UPI0027DFEE98|nr:uncharacterized protein LOC131968486 isoform X2 [Centropristis striata]
MSNTKLQNFRGFLTERFTAVAVEIFGEIESIVEAYYEENKRLRNVLHMVLNPEIKLPKIDDIQNTGATADASAEQLSARVDLERAEPLPKKPKEEQIDYDICCETEQQQVQVEAETFISPDCVKNDPEEEEDTSMPCISDSFHIKVVEVNPNSSGTLTADEEEDCSASDSDAVSDCSQSSRSDESMSESAEAQTHDAKSIHPSKPKLILQKTMLELPRMVPHQSFLPDPNEFQSFLARLTEAFKDFPDDKKPLITKMGLTKNVDLVDCAFGKVPKGSPLSYQCPVPSQRDFKKNDDAPPRPLLPLAHHKLEPMTGIPTLSTEELEHMNVMAISWEAAQSLEETSRESKESVEELRNLRLTGHFKEICKLKPGRSNAEHLIFKIKKRFIRCKSVQVEEELKAGALREYCKHLCVNWSPCGLVIHPNAPWLGALPDGLVYDPNETPSYGLVHVKCIGLRSFTECRFLICRDGALQLKKTHSSYWHIQGEMMVTGTEWCDMLVFSREDMLVQRIYRDATIIKAMKKKLDDFFFYYYLPCLF